MAQKALWLVAVAVLVPEAAAAYGLNATTATSLSSGRYGGTSSTHMSVSALGVSTSVDHWQIDVTLPYVVVDSADASVAVGGLVLQQRANRRKRTAGYSDMTLQVQRSLGGSLPFDMSLRGQLKLPTGARSFSTGKVDMSAGFEVSRTMGALTPFASADYRVYGDSKALPMTNGWSLGAGATLIKGWSIFIASYQRSRSAFGGPDSQELSAVASRRIAHGWSATLYGSKGLSEAAPNLMVGMSLTRSFN